MMTTSRWTQYDEDPYRLPEGITRIGYDADTATYTFRDAVGRIYKGDAHTQYGTIRLANSSAVRVQDRRFSKDDDTRRTRGPHHISSQRCNPVPAWSPPTSPHRSQSPPPTWTVESPTTIESSSSQRFFPRSPQSLESPTSLASPSALRFIPLLPTWTLESPKPDAHSPTAQYMPALVLPSPLSVNVDLPSTSVESESPSFSSSRASLRAEELSTQEDNDDYLTVRDKTIPKMKRVVQGAWKVINLSKRARITSFSASVSLGNDQDFVEPGEEESLPENDDDMGSISPGAMSDEERPPLPPPKD